MLRKVIFLWIAFGSLWFHAPTPALAQESEDLSILDDWLVHRNAKNSLYLHLEREARARLHRRQQEMSAVQGATAWRGEITKVRQTLNRLLGPFPPRTPLQPRILGVLSKPGYRVEKLVFESLPGFYVTAALFIPDPLDVPAPSVLFCSGHSVEGFRSSPYQTVILNLVRKGFVVLAFDPVGQGERLQYADPQTGESKIGGPTQEHSYAGAQSFLNGVSFARYMIWDGIRAIDYLVSRKEVDARRIGVTGRSGGGTQTAYIAALDDRVLAAAPECYITNFQRLLQSIGPQDAEQNFLNGLSEGVDHADLLIARAPKPTLMITTTRDFFSIQGARETFEEVRRVYTALGHEADVMMVEDDAPHAGTPRNRSATYRFFLHHLSHQGNDEDLPVSPLSPEELRITPSGQVLSSLGGRSIFDIVKEESMSLRRTLEEKRRNRSIPSSLVEDVRRLSGFEMPGSAPEAVFAGRYRRPGYAVERYFVAGPGRYVIPFLLLRPDAPGDHAPIIYLNPEGKQVDAGVGGRMETLVRGGFVVLAPDLLGVGELGGGDFRGDAYEFKIGVGRYNTWFFAALLGKSIVGLQAADIVQCVRFLKEEPGIDPRDIRAVALHELGPALLHAAVFEPAIGEITVEGMLGSYFSLTETQYYQPRLIHAAVPGVLTSYDLADLASLLAPRRLVIKNPISADGEPLPVDRARAIFDVARKAYETQGAAGSFTIQTTGH
jgi:dienelactone hydrolase